MVLARSITSSPRPLSTARTMYRLKPLTCSAVIVGGMESSWRFTSTSTSSRPVVAQGFLDSRSQFLRLSPRAGPRMPAASASWAKFGLTRSVAKSSSPAAFISSSTKPSALLLKTTSLTGSLSWRKRQQLAQQHGQTAIAGEADHLAVREGSLGTDGLRQRVGHRAMRERAQQAALCRSCADSGRPRW